MKTVLILALAVAGTQIGCTSRQKAYPGQSSDVVWSAMKSVAHQPAYDDWYVLENNVWCDDDAHRIEVDRRVMRERHDPMSKPMLESRHWAFSIYLKQDEHPTAAFVARSFGVPAHAWVEADRYFDQLKSMLPPADASISTPTPASTPPVPSTPTPAAADDSAASVDIDSMSND